MQGQCSYPNCSYVAFSGFDECGQHVAPTPRSRQVGLFNGGRRELAWEEDLTSIGHGIRRRPGCPCVKLCQGCVDESEWYPSSQCVIAGCDQPPAPRRLACAGHLATRQAYLNDEFRDVFDEPLPGDGGLNPPAVNPSVI